MLVSTVCDVPLLPRASIVVAPGNRANANGQHQGSDIHGDRKKRRDKIDSMGEGTPSRLQPQRELAYNLVFNCQAALYCRYKCKTTCGKDGHGYNNTRGRDELRAAQYRLRPYEALPREVGSKLINLLPLGIREKHR
ncbi:hypothetical protein J6590_023865 [Homalodisca vitripennis]|nr:hypothetical protein J6590_023865 [Homalodisca vitripennis]